MSFERARRASQRSARAASTAAIVDAARIAIFAPSVCSASGNDSAAMRSATVTDS